MNNASLANSTETKKAAANDKKENNFTLLTLLYCVKILIGNFIDSFGLFLIIFSVDIYVKYGFISISRNCLFFASHGMPFFFYYFFYNVFRKKLHEMLRLG